MASSPLGVDPWSRIRSSFPAKTTSNKSLTNILSQISNVQTSRTGIKALGGEEKPKTKKGLVSTLFDPDSSVLFAPYRFISAGLADVAGLAQDTELADYNPLESAFRAARGEFAVTGGDIFQTEEGESIGSRALKLGGAFAWDVFTDPLSYIGGSGVFTRKGLLSATLGDDTLRLNLANKVQSFASKTKNADEVSGLMNRLASQSRDVATGVVRSDAAGNLVDASGKVIAKEARDTLAAKTIANAIADGFNTKGRAGIISSLTTTLGDSALAREVFQSLDQEIVGGLFLKNPITGRPIARIAGGSGKGNAVADVANRARFAAATGFAGRLTSRNLSGKYGPTWSVYKQSLLKAKPNDLVVGRTLFTDFTDYKRAVNKLGGDIRMRIAALQAAQSTILRARNRLAEAEQSKFDDQLRSFFYNPSRVALAGEGDLADDASIAALEVRDAFAKLHQELLDAGVEVGTQKDFSPLMYSDDYLEFLETVDPVSGKDYRGRYNGSKTREAHMVPLADEDLAGLVPTEDAATLRAKSPVEANEVANQVLFKGKKISVFETDPIKLLQRYSDWAVRTIEVERFVRSLKQSGIVVDLGENTARVANLHNAKAGLEVLGQLAPQAEQIVRQRAKQMVDEMADLVSDNTVAAREAQRVGLINNAQQQLDSTANDLAVSVSELRKIDTQIAELEPSVEKLQKVILDRRNVELIRDTGKLQEAVASLSRSVRNAKTRLANARESEVLNRQIGATQKASIAADRVDQFEDELAGEFESLIDVRNSLNIVTETLNDNAALLATRQFDEFVEYGRLLEQKVVLSEQVRDLRAARKVAKDNLDLVKRDVAMPRASTIRTATYAYVQLRRRHNMAVRKLRNTPKDLRTPEMKAGVKQARLAANDAAENLRRLIADVNPSRSKVQTAGRNYFKEILKAADKLTDTQVEAIFTLTDRKTVDRLMLTLYDPGITHDARMGVVGDMMSVYSRIRDVLTKEELDRFEVYNKYLFDEPKNFFQKEGKRQTAKLTRLQDDLDAAIYRGDEKTADKLKTEIERLELFTADDGLKLVGAGKVKVPKTLEGLYAPLGVREPMERLYMLNQSPNEWEEFIGRIFDPLTLVWKMSATVGRGPGYLFTNLIGGILNNWIGNVSVGDHALAAKMLSVYNKNIKKAMDADPNAPLFEVSQRAVTAIEKEMGNLMVGDKLAVEVFQDFLETGVWLTSQVMEQSVRLRQAGLLTDPSLLSKRYQSGYDFVTEEVGKSEKALQRTVNFLLTWPGQRFLSDLNQNVEMFVRLSAFNSGYRRFGSKTSAFENAMLLQFDYQDLSDAEHWVRRFLPFYTWTRNNIPLQLRALFMQQDRLRKLIVFNENLKDAFGVDGDDSWLSEVLPEYLDVNGGFASVFKFGGNHLALFPKTPLQNVDEIFSVSTAFGIPFPSLRMDRIAGMLGPVVSPLEFITNTNFDTGQQFRSGGDKAQQMARSLVPYIGTAQRVATSATLPFYAAGVELPNIPLVNKEKAMADLLNLIVGAPYGVSTLGEKQVYGGLIQKSVASANQLRSMAAAAGVDYEWLRKEIRKGVTVAQLRAKIARGEGSLELAARKLEKPDAKERERQKKQASEYSRILESFGRGQFGGF